jgi:tol-pal system protein YbgF
MRLIYWLAAVALGLTISGCSDTDVIMKKQMEMEARLEQLVQGNSAVNARLAELTTELKEARDQVKANSTDLEELKPALKEIKDTLESAAPRKEQATAPVAVPRIEVVNRDAPPADKEVGAQNVYMKAFGLFSANNYPAAIEAFEAFIKANPDSEYAGNAQYWIGECYYTQHNFPQALEAFNKVLTKYPQGHKVPDAMLKVGFSLISMNEPVKARGALQALIDKFPKSQAAVKARERLK